MSEEMKPMLIVSSSPHVHSGASVQRIMLDVILALTPALVFALYAFGVDALRLVLVCVAACVMSEALTRKAMGRKPGIDDLSAVVTGILLAFNLPPSLPSWMAALGSAFAIVIGKQLFGGIGYNPFNPALLGRAMLLVAFPVPMTAAWSAWHIPSPMAADAVTTATPLGLLKTSLLSGGGMPYSFDAATAWPFFLGFKNGSIGEVSGLALLIGAAYLLYRRCIYWQIPVFFVGTVALFASILHATDPAMNMGPLFHVLTGGVILGAFFMATDMVTSPVTRTGMAVFGAGCGLLTMLIRKWGGYPEGVSFAILIMNALVPLIDRATKPRVFGHRKR
jgi:Na+-translocating ferredoxin:NAD+ oxidoreductase subunit D